MTSSKPKRRICAYCKKLVAIRKDGKLRQHAERRGFYGPVICMFSDTPGWLSNAIAKKRGLL